MRPTHLERHGRILADRLSDAEAVRYSQFDARELQQLLTPLIDDPHKEVQKSARYLAQNA